MKPECHAPSAVSNFTSAKAPIWRLVLYGLLAIGAFAWLGHTFGDRQMVWIGVFTIPLLIVLMLGLIQVAQGQWAKQNLRFIIWIYIILQSVLLIWTWIDKK